MFSLGLCIPVAMGQTVTGSVTGQNHRSFGAVVPGAQIVAHNLDTGVDSPATTNGVGLYRIDFLPIGHYQVTIQVNGFQTRNIPPFSLEAQQTGQF